MSRKQVLIAVAVAVLVALGIGAYFVFGPQQTTATAASETGYEIVPTDRTLGDPKAPVVLIEYAAPVCPHCAHFNAEVFPQIKQKYIDSHKVFYVFRVFPLHPADGAAEKLARCLPKERYFSFMDLLFRNQPKWDPEYAAENSALQTPEGIHAGLIQLARVAGMSPEQADRCLDNTAEDERINKVAADGQMRYSITGTPTFVVNGTPVGQGTVPSYAEMQKFLDDALAAKH